MAQEKPRTKAEQRIAMMHTLIEVGRAQFAQHGYAQTATEEIVRQAEVTRGALYHHFGNKEGLFVAVLKEVQNDVSQRILAAVETTDDPWEQLLVGCRAFLQIGLDPEIQQIMLIDGPAVLGWETWREIDATHSMKSLREGMQALIDNGLINVSSGDAITHLLSGAMNEAVLWIASAEQPYQALDEAVGALEQLLNGLASGS